MQGKKILLGISGGIAAYKTPFLIRELTKRGSVVKVIATENALQFVTLMTLQTLSGNPVYHDMFSPYAEDTVKHVSLADWADIFIVAPATADVIGKYANAVADDALTTSLIAFSKQVFLCPAMNDVMYGNKSVRRNIDLLKRDGVIMIEGDSGFLACGREGKGRMPSPEDIVAVAERYYTNTQTLKGKTVTITAGPTREKIDGVRFISNNSSGKMGIALAEEMLQRGAEVNLVIGHVTEDIPCNDGLKVIRVESAQDMYEAAIPLAENSDIIICSAAVADYTPKTVYEGKIKKHLSAMTLELVPTKDILYEIGKVKKDSQVLVGFALETENELENAKSKLRKKNSDFIVLNSLRDTGAGFEKDTNKVTVINRKEELFDIPLQTKRKVASDIIDIITEYL